jgi:hypothetical protein
MANQGTQAPVVPYSNAPQLLSPYDATARLPGARVSFAFWRQPVYQLSDGTYWHPGSEGPTYLVNIDSQWSYLYLGIPSTQPYTPGKLTITEASKWRDVDKKKAAGNDGARISIHGIEPSLVEMELLIWTPEQLRQLANLWPILFPAAYKGAPPAYDVDHPLLRIHGVKAIQFVKGSGPYVDAKGIGTFRMTAWEFLQPSKKNETKTNVQALGSLLDAGTTSSSPSSFSTPGATAANLGPR